MEQTGGLDVVSVHTTVYCIVTFIADLEVPSWSPMLEYGPLQQVFLTVNLPICPELAGQIIPSIRLPLLIYLILNTRR